MNEPPTKEEVDAKAAEVFELRDLNAPVVSGFPLRIMTHLLESRILGHPLRQKILINSGFVAFRQRAAAAQDDDICPAELPIHYPLPTASGTPELSHIDDLFHVLGTENASAGSARPTIRDYYDAYKSGRTTPRRVAERIIRLIAESNGPQCELNAVSCIKDADLLDQAETSTERWAMRRPLSVLDGVPYTVKASLDVAGFPTWCASGFAEDNPTRPEDSDAVQALRNAGMVMIGKCNQDELGLGVRGFSMFSGQTRNPHNTEYVPGGSSSGCAASVAAGLCPVSIGSDAGGSIRIPAACCGVFGIKPTFARVSTHGRMLTQRNAKTDEVSASLHVGPIATCAEDLAVIYSVLAGFAPHRPIPSEPAFAQHPEQVPKSLLRSIEGLRVGVCLPWLQSASELGYSRTRYALERMISQGAVEVPVIIPDLEETRVALSVSIMKTFLHSLKEHGAYGEGTGNNVGHDARGKLAVGQKFTDDDVARAKTVRAKAMRYCVETLFSENNLDVLVTPSLGTETPAVPTNLVTGLVDVNTDSKMMKFSVYGNCIGIPGCTIPVGKDESTGLPYSIQVMAAPWNERILLEVALWGEKEFMSHKSLKPTCSLNPLDG